MARRGNSEGTITKRKDGRWEARVSLPNGRRKVLYARTRSEVAEKLLTAQKSISDGLPLPSDRQTLENFLTKWLEDSAKPTLRPYTYLSYAGMIGKHIVPELGRISVAKLSPQQIQGFLNSKKESGLSARTVQYLHAILRSALAQAELWGLVPRNVARLVTPPRVTKADVQPLTPAEVKQLLAAIENDRLSALFTVAIALGLRQGEALGLTWDSVDLEAGTLQIRTTLQRINGATKLAEPKTVKSRRNIRIPNICVESLRRHRASQNEERNLNGPAWRNDWNLVFTQADGSPLSRHAVNRRYHHILKDAGIPKHRFHDLRHTCATLLLAQGVPLKVVQELLGHTLFSTTADIYSHILPVLMDDAADKMNSVLAS